LDTGHSLGRVGHSKIAHTGLPLLTSALFIGVMEVVTKTTKSVKFFFSFAKLKLFTRGLQPGLTELDATETANCVYLKRTNVEE